MRETIHTILELIGFIESAETIIKRKLGIASQTKPRGPVTVVVNDIGPMKISAVNAIRQLTGLNLKDAIAYTDLLPWPLLRNVTLETALDTKQWLERMGASVELTGVPERVTSRKDRDVRDTQPSERQDEAAIPAGEYVVILNKVGLLPERVIEGMVKLARLSLEQAQAIADNAPRPIIAGVDEVTAQLLQRDLQMVGAVVDLLKSDEYAAAADVYGAGGAAVPAEETETKAG